MNIFTCAPANLHAEDASSGMSSCLSSEPPHPALHLMPASVPHWRSSRREMNGFSSLHERGSLQFPASGPPRLNDRQMALIQFGGFTRARDYTRNTLVHRQGLAGQEQDAGNRQPVAHRD